MTWIKNIISNFDSVRFKIIESCNWSCHFCHNEWNITAGKIQWGDKLHNIFQDLKAVWLKEVHLTGGEPSLNKDIKEIIGWLHSLGLTVKMTTNGQFNEKIKADLIESKIDAINVSVQSINPYDLLKIMTQHHTIEWAEAQIHRMQRNIIDLIQNNIKLRANVVLSSEDELHKVTDIMTWTQAHNIELRVLDNILSKQTSYLAIQKLLKQTHAKFIEKINISWTSSSRSVFELPNGYNFIVKHIEPIYLSQICHSCDNFKNNTCNEGFYTIRLQFDFQQKEYIIMLCMQNHNTDTILSVNDFLYNLQNNYYELQDFTRWSNVLGRPKIFPIKPIATSK